MSRLPHLSATHPPNGHTNTEHAVVEQAVVASKSSSSSDLLDLQSASRVLVDQLVKDAQAVPELGDTLTIPGIPSSDSYSVYPDDYRVPFQKRRFVAMPDELFQHFHSTSLTTHMGLMPELERAWVSVDNNLFLWDYMQGYDLSSFTEQPDVITHVALVKPKPGVFIDEIAWLLVICTPISVLLIGVSSNPASLPPGHRPRQDIRLYATEMSVPCESEMTSVIGTSDGRIFMRGVQDGSLYEFHYQEKEGWFGKRVQLINHSIGGVQSFLPILSAAKPEDRIVSLVSDPSRNCFYALSTKNAISVYRTNGEKAVQHCQTLVNLYKAAQDKAPGCPALTPQTFNIVSLHVLEGGRAQSGAHLVALTTNGLRLYFAPSAAGPSYAYGFGNGPSPVAAPRPLQLIHVRLPPSNLQHPDEPISQFGLPLPAYGTAPQADRAPRPVLVKGVELSCYDAGLTLAVQTGDTEGRDFILCMAPDLTRIGTLGQVSPAQQQPQTQYMNPYNTNATPSRPPLTEYAILLAIPGHTYAMAPVPRPSVAAAASSPPDSPPYSILNELASQFSEPTRQFMVLTYEGLTFLAKRRALEYLQAVIEECHVENNVQPLIQFRDSFGRDQTCGMLLAMACGNTFLDIGEQSLGTLTTVSPELAVIAKQAFYDFGERPIWAERTTYGTGDAAASGSATFSGRREGFALYFARLVRPLWKTELTKPGGGNLQEPNVSDEILITVQKNLYALKDFLDKNPHLFHSAPGEYTGARAATASEQEAWKAEQNSVAQLMALLARTIEAVSFILLLMDHRLGELISQCDPAVQKLVTSLTFEQLITTADGVTASRALVNVVINQQIGQQISVDTISEVLQQRCGSFCSTDDVLLYKAKENVRKAVETTNPSEKRRWLEESLRLFSKGARILEFEKLREICGDFQHLKFAKGAIELPLFCANIYDADGRGKEFWAVGFPANDPRAESWERRLNCYDLALDSLAVFEEQATTSRQSASPTNDDPAAVRTHAYELAFQSEDEMFHSTLYDWLIDRNLADELLEMRPAYLEAQLRREPSTIQKYQLLWQFYVKDGQPLRAAEVLAALASSTDFDIFLDTRLEYLTLAVGNAKSHPVSAGGRHETAIAFLTDLEEKLEVAQVQLELYNTLLPHANDPGEDGEKVRLLSKALYTITELYQAFAEPFDLPEIKLLIFHVSGHRDETLIRPIWNRIFEDAREGAEPKVAADRIMAKIIPLGHRFHPSESAFPIRHIANLLVRFGLANKGVLPYGWAPRVLIQSGVPYSEVWDIFHEMYESQIPPFNDQANVQAVSSDIAVLLNDWVDDTKRAQSTASRGELPVYRIDQAVEQYLAELAPERTETRSTYENLKRQLRRNW